ncbi:uncharacterized protein LOC124451441 [Xenia sp. Carnegie-2017]|uniref:uncharacterized protein LOC124451441 n=1 Tax=Xenia sp. Carnegie-2017 TaxID=2897299 RepID=UPI001F0451DA|nr:uncharacterized protein LOC124451441 [Xenia sp. Carnegie-2017]
MILFSLKHACLDGVSAVKFVEQFMNCMNEISSRVTNADMHTISFPLLPSGHDLVTQKKIGHSIFRSMVTIFGLRPVLDFLLGKMISYVLKKKAINPYYIRYPHLQSAEIRPESQPCLNLKAFSMEETKSIVDACRANGCTVTGAITAAVHLAFYDLIGEKDEEKTKLETFYPLNNRSYGDPKAPEEYLGYFVYFLSKYMKYPRCSQGDFWMMAKESTVQLKQTVSKKAFMTEMSLMSVLDPKLLLDSYCDESAFLKSITNVISSYGVFNSYNSQASQMTYSLENCYVLPIVRGNNTMFTHFVYTINDKLTWMIISDVHIPSAHAGQFSNYSFNILLNNCSVVEKSM